MTVENENVQNRLDQAMNGGTPKINPDEQRRYLGTFRERVALAIKNSEVYQPAAIAAVEKLIQSDNSLTIIINGNIPSSQQSPYIKIATKNNAKFTLTTDKIYGTNPNDYAVVVAAKTAINEPDVAFHEPVTETNAPDEPKKSFWQKLFNK
ncbi:YueI family protein [Fructilactobacillus sp. Tb1]|uniref:YueI family protein n=1 Tax=Fructilactobacillus sp. Tb1 TaxID=3422304 RepID=UPI003D2A85C6